MLVRLYVVIDKEDDNLEMDVKQRLNAFCPQLSFSPSRPQPSLAHCLEFYGTANIEAEDIDSLLQELNNDWEGSQEDCSAYGFNTQMFHEHVYYLQFQIL